jgi:hypothetical protein
MVEALGIEPYAPRYANPKRTLGFPAYRYQRHATRSLTHVPSSTLESSCLPCALVTIWSLSISAWVVKAMAFALVLPVAGGRERHVQQVKLGRRLA